MRAIIASVRIGNPEQAIWNYFTEMGAEPVSVNILPTTCCLYHTIMDRHGPPFDLDEEQVQCLVMDDDVALLLKLADVVNIIIGLDIICDPISNGAFKLAG